MRKLLVVSIASFAIALLVFTLTRDDDAVTDEPRTGRTAALDRRVAQLQRAAARDPDDAKPLILLASMLLADVRGPDGDTRDYIRADEALAEALRRDPRSAAAYTERGILKLGRHDFFGALEDGERARELAPGTVKPLGVVADANVETGRYDEAEKILQEMVDLKPNLDSYSRVAYFRELQGDLDGALVVLDLAASAGGAGPENVAFVQSLAGHLELAQQRPERALAAFRAALQRVPGYSPAEAGLARLDIAAGRTDEAITRLRKLVENDPKQEYVVLLGELELFDGQTEAGRKTLSMVPEGLRALESAGENTETEKALFEADHGDPTRALEAGRNAWKNGPSVRAADALGWALTRAGRPEEGLEYARRALKLGSRDPGFLFRAGMTAKEAGRPDDARRWLGEALTNPGFSPLHARTARRTLDAL